MPRMSPRASEKGNTAERPTKRLLRSESGSLSRKTTRLQVVKEVEGDFARSPSITPTNGKVGVSKSSIKGSVSVLDRFGRTVWLEHNSEADIDEVHIDEDGYYYLFSEEGLRVKLQADQIHGDNTSQPYCLRDGRRVNIRIVPDRLRSTMLKDAEPSSDNIAHVPADPRPTEYRSEPKPSNLGHARYKTKVPRECSNAGGQNKPVRRSWSRMMGLGGLSQKPRVAKYGLAKVDQNTRSSSPKRSTSENVTSKVVKERAKSWRRFEYFGRTEQRRPTSYSSPKSQFRIA